MQIENSDNAGFSLIELTIAMSVTLVLVGISAAMLSGSFNIRRRENRRTEALAAAQHALNMMSRDIGNSGFGLRRNGIVDADSDVHSIRIRANLDAFSGVVTTVQKWNGASYDSVSGGSVSLADPDEDIEYFMHAADPSDATSTRGDLMRYDVNTNQSRVLVSNVDDLEIYYFSQKVDYTMDGTGGINVTTLDGSGSPVTDEPDTGNVTYVVITILLKLEQVGQPGSPGYVPAGQIQLATDVALRNRNLAMF
jgi:type II secretory pathway pseudopilin PulG